MQIEQKEIHVYFIPRFCISLQIFQQIGARIFIRPTDRLQNKNHNLRSFKRTDITQSPLIRTNKTPVHIPNANSLNVFKINYSKYQTECG